MESDLPWVPGAIMELLLEDAEFTQACHDRLTSRTPDDVTAPYSTVQTPAPATDLGGGVYRVLVQVDGWCPGEWVDEDPETVVWRIASRARRVLRAARNVRYETMWFTVRPLELGSLPPDITRGESSPIYRAVMRGVVNIHNR